MYYSFIDGISMCSMSVTLKTLSEVSWKQEEYILFFLNPNLMFKRVNEHIHGSPEVNKNEAKESQS